MPTMLFTSNGVMEPVAERAKVSRQPLCEIRTHGQGKYCVLFESPYLYAFVTVIVLVIVLGVVSCWYITQRPYYEI